VIAGPGLGSTVTWITVPGAAIGSAVVVRLWPGRTPAAVLGRRVAVCCPGTGCRGTGYFRTGCPRTFGPGIGGVAWPAAIGGGLAAAGGRPLRRGRGRGGRWLVRR
jgi:hypothetical protein